MLCTEWTNECDGRESEVFSYANVRKECTGYKWALPFFSALTLCRILSIKHTETTTFLAGLYLFSIVSASSKLLY